MKIKKIVVFFPRILRFLESSSSNKTRNKLALYLYKTSKFKCSFILHLFFTNKFVILLEFIIHL